MTFAYDSATDQYEEVFEDEDLFNNNYSCHPEIVIKPRPRLRSSRSVRSFREKVPFSTRIVTKTGRLNTLLTKLPKKNLKYIRDLGNTLLHIQWRWILLTLFVVNAVSFILFAFLLMWISYVSGDWDEDAGKEQPCIVNAKSFVSYFLLSVETIMTIGYGTRYPTENCKQVWILHVLQALIGVVMQGVLVSAVYVKITKPFTKNPMRLFSKRAVICIRDGQLCFMFRINDTQGKIAAGTKINLYFIDKNEDSKQLLVMKEMKILPFGLLIFPTEVEHVIDEDSPLWSYSPYKLLTSRYEIVAVAEGTSIITGQISQNKTSYVSGDILWGHRFQTCVEFDELQMRYVVHNKKINKTVMFDTPLCSAEELEGFKIDYPEVNEESSV